MNKWVIILVVVTLAIGASSGVAFALADGGDTPLEVEPGGGIGSGAGPLPAGPIRSDEDIDPDECNLIHNINACDEEELEALGATYLAGSIATGEPEPLYEDDEPQYEVQSFEEAVEQDCGLAGGTFYVSSDGEFGCVPVQVLEDGGEGETQAQPPVVVPEPEVLPAE